MGLPSSSQPMNPGLNFATINAETLDEASREMEFKVPEDKVIDRVRPPPCTCLRLEGLWPFRSSASVKCQCPSCIMIDHLER